MSHTNQYKKTMSIVGGHTNEYTNPSYFVETMNLVSKIRQAERSYTYRDFSFNFHENPLSCLITNEASDALINYSVRTLVRDKSSKSKLCGGMYSANNNSNIPCNGLESKLEHGATISLFKQ